MSLVGTRLGPYEIVASIGVGGMGEVFKAHDTRLDRDVALKILPAHAAGDPDRLRRFEQEARATAALNHPNILAVFDVGSEADVNYVVSELLEGETLRDRLKAGALTPRKAVDYAAQMARGLAAAHEKGIVHRDLKPENIFLTRDGRLKILDFGIAKLLGAGAGDETAAPTLEMGTTPGMVLGTIGYMSPEQVRGLSTDHRTDIFSFGAILYEMLSGHRAFAGATQADTLSAILSADPPEILDAAHPVPAILDRLVRRCLEKSPEERFQSARDIGFNLDAISTTSGHGTSAVAAVEVPPPTSRPRLTRIAAALAIGLVIGAAGTWLTAIRWRPAPAPVRFQQLTFRRGTILSARFSPDGETVVYSSEWEGKEPELYSTRVGAIGERALGIHGQLLAISKAGEMAVLLDRQALANWMFTGTLARAPLGGGAPREVLRDIGGADWSPDGQQLAITRFMPSERHWRLEYPVGTVILDTDTWLESPRISPDGSQILLLEHPITGDNRGRVVEVTLKGQKTVLTPEYPSVVGDTWSPAGDEAWFTASTGGLRLELLAVRPGGQVRQIAPTPASVLVDDARADGRTLIHTLSLKARMLVKTPADAEERDISWFDFPLLRDMSADGSTILFDEEGEGGGPNYSVFVRRTDGSPAIRIGDGYALALSPDMQWALTSMPSDSLSAFTMVPIGPGEPRKITIPLQRVVSRVHWFPDGKRLLVTGNEAGRPRRAYEYTIDSGKVRPISPEGTTGIAVSPDGRLLLGRAADGKPMVWPVDGGEGRELPGVGAEEFVSGWAADARSVYVSARGVVGRDLARLDVTTGRRERITIFGAADSAGLQGFGVPAVSADGRTYAYRYNQMLSDLFVAQGLR